jgi:3-hydroxybutyryl-CoA dehydratase
MASAGLLEVGTEIPAVTKEITREKIDLFEACGILDRASIHTDRDLAARKLGTSYAVASGRMSISFVSEALRKLFGADAFHRTGCVNLKFLRPVKDGDLITVRGRVSQLVPEDGGTRVTVEVWCENQDGHKTAAGTGNATVSSR